MTSWWRVTETGQVTEVLGAFQLLAQEILRQIGKMRPSLPTEGLVRQLFLSFGIPESWRLS